MRMFWSLFFLGSMLLVGTDVAARRGSVDQTPMHAVADGDPTGWPTPNP